MHRLVRREREAATVWSVQDAAAVRARRRTIAAVVVAALALACVEREVSGKHEGSLRALLAPYVVRFTDTRVS